MQIDKENVIIMNKSNIKKIYWIFILAILFCVFLFFYLNEAFIFNSDIDDHFGFALDLHFLPEMGVEQFSQKISNAHILSYPGWHLLFLALYTLIEKLSIVFGYGLDIQTTALWAQAIENAILLLITFIVIVNCFYKYYGLAEKSVLILGIVNMVIGPLYIPGVSEKYYLGQFTANPWHNPTTLIIKPMAIICFYLFCHLYNCRDYISEKDQNKSCVLLAVSLLLSAWLKPSFYQAFVPALFIFCVIDVLRTKFSSFKFCVKIGFAVLPVCMLALLQYTTSFGETGNGIIWSPWTVWNIFSNNKGISLLVSLAFPLVVMALNGSKVLKNSDTLLSLCFFASSVLQFICFSLANNAKTGDFLWAVYLSVLMLFMSGENLMLQMKLSKAKYLFCSVLLIMHFVCGLGYFIGIYVGGKFDI